MILAVDSGTATIVAAVIGAIATIAAVGLAQGWFTRGARPVPSGPSFPEPVREFAAKLTGAMNAVDDAVLHAPADDSSERVSTARWLVGEAAGLVGGVRPLVTQEAADQADHAIAALLEAARLLDLEDLTPAHEALDAARSASRNFESAIRV